MIPTKIIGIDPSTSVMGWCLATLSDKEFNINDYGISKFKQSKKIEDRIIDIFQATKLLTQLHRPHVLGIEASYLSKTHFNSKVLSGLAMGRAAAILGIASGAGSIKVTTYSIMPSTAKKAVAKGNATKQEVSDAIERKFNIKSADLTHDMSDAIAIAYAASLRHIEDTS